MRCRRPSPFPGGVAGGGWGVSAVTRWRWDFGGQGAPQDDPNPHCGRCLSQHRHRSDQYPLTASSSTHHSLGSTAELTNSTKARHRVRGAQKAAAQRGPSGAAHARTREPASSLSGVTAQGSWPALHHPPTKLKRKYGRPSPTPRHRIHEGHGQGVRVLINRLHFGDSFRFTGKLSQVHKE